MQTPMNLGVCIFLFKKSLFCLVFCFAQLYIGYIYPGKEFAYGTSLNFDHKQMNDNRSSEGKTMLVCSLLDRSLSLVNFSVPNLVV